MLSDTVYCQYSKQKILAIIIYCTAVLHIHLHYTVSAKTVWSCEYQIETWLQIMLILIWYLMILYKTQLFMNSLNDEDIPLMSLIIAKILLDLGLSIVVATSN